MNPLIVDASVAVKWVLYEPHREAALALIGNNLHAPDWLRVEYANVLWKKIQREQLSHNIAEELYNDIGEVPIRFHSAVAYVDDAFSLASELQHSVYDCLYLALAMRLKGVCVTDDRKFFLAASSKRKYKSHMLLLEESAATLYH